MSFTSLALLLIVKFSSTNLMVYSRHSALCSTGVFFVLMNRTIFILFVPYDITVMMMIGDKVISL